MLLGSLLAGLLCSVANVVLAEKSTSGNSSRGQSGITYDLSATPFYQPSAKLDGGGNFSLGSLFTRFKIGASVSERTTAGLSLKYDLDDYDFDGTTEFGRLPPWNDARRFGISVPIFTRLPSNWLFNISPAVNWLYEQGANHSESASYGATTFLLKSYSREKSIGLGAGIFREVDEDNKVFPFVAVNWKFNEHWKLSNPFDADVLGPAGLELAYSFDDRWRLGAGGVYRSFRFRLDREGIAPNGIGGNKGWVGFLRLQRTGRLGVDFDAYVGATFDGELELQDQFGERVSSAGYETAPFVAVSLSGSF